MIAFVLSEVHKTLKKREHKNYKIKFYLCIVDIQMRNKIMSKKVWLDSIRKYDVYVICVFF
jgi:hypothetical protein